MDQTIRMKVIDLGEFERNGRSTFSKEGTVNRDVKLARNGLEVVPIHSHRAPGRRRPLCSAIKRAVPSAEISHDQYAKWNVVSRSSNGAVFSCCEDDINAAGGAWSCHSSVPFLYQSTLLQW